MSMDQEQHFGSYGGRVAAYGPSENKITWCEIEATPSGGGMEEHRLQIGDICRVRPLGPGEIGHRGRVCTIQKFSCTDKFGFRAHVRFHDDERVGKIEPFDLIPHNETVDKVELLFDFRALELELTDTQVRLVKWLAEIKDSVDPNAQAEIAVLAIRAATTADMVEMVSRYVVDSDAKQRLMRLSHAFNRVRYDAAPVLTEKSRGSH